MALQSTPTMRAFAAGVRSKVPTLLSGAPGLGKTAKITAYGEAWGAHVEAVIGSVREPADYLGLPIIDGDQTVYAPPSWALNVNAAEKSLLFFGELTTSAPSTQKAMLRVMQERYAGDLKLNDGVSIVADANPPEQAVDGWDLAGPVANRMMHLDWHFDADEWLDGVLNDFDHTVVYSMEDLLNDGSDSDKARAVGLINAFLRTQRQWIAPPPPTDPVEAGKAWPSPRSWTNAGLVLGHLRADDEAAMLLVLKGCVGEKAATALTQWAAIRDLHDPADVMADPSIVDWTEARPDKLYAVTMSVAALAVGRNDEKSMRQARDAFVACAKAGRPDVSMPAMKRVVDHFARDNRFVRTAAFDKAFADLLRRAGGALRVVKAA